ncbi:MAG: prenyltransferase [Thermoplasmatota archaeon]
MSGKNEKPGILDMIRAPFLFAIIVPLVSGTLVSISITGNFNLIGFVLIFIIGISLHITTNVYNDIYDTKQGADNKYSMKSEFSGGSGIIVDHPELLPKMFLIARLGIVFGIIGSILLMLFIDRALWLPLWLIIGISIFLTKYYTAEPIKFAYRGLGEVVVWLGFGPLAVLLSGIGQNLGFHPVLLSISPITGFGTLFIVWMGEMVDLPTDIEGGKVGLVARLGFKRSRYGLMIIHILALINISFIAFIVLNPGWVLLVAVIPHLLFLPMLWSRLSNHKEYDEKVKSISGLNFKLYALFSFFLMAGYGLDLIWSIYF